MRRPCRCLRSSSCVLIVGVLIGGIAAWIRQSKWRRTARKLDADLRALRQEMDVMSARETYRGPQQGAEPPPTPLIPPAFP